jgi:hypothetical protein
MRTPWIAAVLTISLIAIAALLATGGQGTAAPQLPASGPISKAEATAYAHEVNLIPADVPGMVSISEEGEHGPRHRPRPPGCRTFGHAGRIVGIRSSRFRSGLGLHLKQVSSEVEVVATPGQLRRKRAELVRELQTTCLQREVASALASGVTKELNGRGAVTVGATKSSVVHPDVPGSLGLQTVTPFTITTPVESEHGNLYADVLAFFVGRAEVDLFYYGTSGAVLTEAHLLSVLYQRAQR